MLFATLAVLGAAALLGLWLSAMFLVYDTAPRHSAVVALIHGAAGAVGLGLLYLTLNQPGAGSRFAWTALIVLAAALLGGLVILSFNLRRRPVAPVVIAMHACVAMAGVVMLAAYFTTHASYGH